ncbi:unnamed protein product [Parascedosporium putredinis]|uniref:NAD(P)-binding protein n=1 Tax=Parascedosporium putredinis TaxID=1442378 RepID=A0A9P1GZN4_9PEZI|nr:unnamed protein product [Parascedosporium putredinis]CAI7991033.1 unnamed protein product [Parascedosporium putredinis]
MMDMCSTSEANPVSPGRKPTSAFKPVDLSSPYDRDAVAGKTILITGGASGLGAAFAKTWASHGAHVIIGDVDDAAGEALVADLRATTKSEHHHYQHCDVTDWQSQVALFKMAASVSPTKGIDVVVPNAGIGHDGVFDVNLTGAAYTVHLALFWLQKNEPGRDRAILLIGSIAGLIPLVGSAQYTASKHAITGLFRCLRGTSYRKGIRVNMLCPYFLEDVVDAGTRLVADDKIYGRGLVVGPRMVVQDTDEGEIKLVQIPTGTETGKPIWDCYAHDYHAAQAFVYRYTLLLVGIAKIRGWFGWLTDVSWILFKRRPEQQPK